MARGTKGTKAQGEVVADGANGARQPGGQKGKKAAADATVKVPLYLSRETVVRLDVHCGIKGRNRSKEADRILLMYLRDKGATEIPSFGVGATNRAEAEDPPVLASGDEIEDAAA